MKVHLNCHAILQKINLIEGKGKNSLGVMAVENVPERMQSLRRISVEIQISLAANFAAEFPALKTYSHNRILKGVVHNRIKRLASKQCSGVSPKFRDKQFFFV
jgi:hypothetical protein